MVEMFNYTIWQVVKFCAFKHILTRPDLWIKVPMRLDLDEIEAFFFSLFFSALFSVFSNHFIHRFDLQIRMERRIISLKPTSVSDQLKKLVLGTVSG